MTQTSGVAQVVLAFSALILIPSAALQAREQGGKKPSLSLKATPAISFAPSRVVMVVEVKGGSDDFEDFYCPTLEWEWDDLTRSTQESDCAPYEAGKSTIRRRYTIERQFKNAGSYRVVVRFKKSTRVVAAANTQVQVRAGLGDPGF